MCYTRGVVKISGKCIPIVFTLRELGQHTVIIAVNRVIPACTAMEIEGRVMKNVVKNPNNTHKYLVNAAGEELIVDSILTESKLVRTQKGETLEYVPLLPVNISDRKRYIKRGDIFATIEPFQQKEYELMYEDDQTVVDHPRNEASSTINDVAGNTNSLQVHIASIIARRPKFGEREGKMSVKQENTVCQPESKGGVGSVSFMPHSGDPFTSDIEVLSNTLVGNGVKQEDSSHSSRKGLKVPLEVNERTDTTVGRSEQPQSKGSLMSSNSHFQVEKV